MNLIEIATHTQSQLDQSTARIAELAAEVADCKKSYAELEAYKSAMEAKVSAVLQSGDPAQYEALAQDFLTPLQEKERLAKLARIEQLKAETAALEATI